MGQQPGLDMGYPKIKYAGIKIWIFLPAAFFLQSSPAGARASEATMACLFFNVLFGETLW